MLNIGPAELIVILLVALLIVGPKRLPEVGRSVGKALREIRRQTDEVRSSFEATINPDLDTDVHDETGREGRDAIDEPVEEWDDESAPEVPSHEEDAALAASEEEGEPAPAADRKDRDPGPGAP
jgi:sec-independent protein translocase protein TatB